MIVRLKIIKLEVKTIEESLPDKTDLIEKIDKFDKGVGKKFRDEIF